MAAPDYKRALSILIQDGTVTLQQVRDAVARTWDETKPMKVGPTWDAAVRILTKFNESLVSNHHRPSRVNESALSCVEKMLRLDKRTEPGVLSLIGWVSSHDFWSSVILSPEKLRKHYDTMAAQRDRDNRVPDVKAEEVVRTQASRASSAEWEIEIERRRLESKPMPRGFKNVLRTGAEQ